MINVVRGLDSLASGICQNPLFASNLLNILAPASLARVSSTLGIGCASLITLVLSGFRSTHIRHAPEVLGTTTIPAHQGVGSVISEMTPSLSILSIAPPSPLILEGMLHFGVYTGHKVQLLL